MMAATKKNSGQTQWKTRHLKLKTPEKASEYQKIKKLLISPKAKEKKVIRDRIKGKQNFATNKLK